MAGFRHDDDDAQIGAKRYQTLNPWKTDLFALVDDDDETAWRKSGARTKKRRFGAGTSFAGNAEQRQKAKKKLENASQEIIQQLGLNDQLTQLDAARIADKVRREKVNDQQQIAMLASGAMPSSVPSWLEFEIRKAKANIEYQVMAANPAALKALMLNAPQSMVAQIAQRMGFIADVATKTWVQEFLAADARDAKLAKASETKPLPLLSAGPHDVYLDKLKGIPNALSPDFSTMLNGRWAEMGKNLALGTAFAAQTRDMHGLMNPALNPALAQKVYAAAPATRPFSDAGMELRETKMLYSKLHMQGMNDGQIARHVHVASAVAQVRSDIDARNIGSRSDSDFQRQANNTLKELRNANQNIDPARLPPNRIAAYVKENAGELLKSKLSVDPVQSQFPEVASSRLKSSTSPIAVEERHRSMEPISKRIIAATAPVFPEVRHAKNDDTPKRFALGTTAEPEVHRKPSGGLKAERIALGTTPWAVENPKQPEPIRRFSVGTARQPDTDRVPPSAEKPARIAFANPPRVNEGGLPNPDGVKRFGVGTRVTPQADGGPRTVENPRRFGLATPPPSGNIPGQPDPGNRNQRFALGTAAEPDKEQPQLRTTEGRRFALATQPGAPDDKNPAPAESARRVAHGTAPRPPEEQPTPATGVKRVATVTGEKQEVPAAAAQRIKAATVVKGINAPTASA